MGFKEFTLRTVRLDDTSARPPPSPIAMVTRTGVHSPPGGSFGGQGVPRSASPAELRELEQRAGPGYYDDDISVVTERSVAWGMASPSSREQELKREPRSLSPGPLPPSPRLLQDGLQLASTTSTHGTDNSVGA